MVVGKYVYRWVGRNHVGGRHKNIEDESKQPLFYHNNICMDMYGYDGSDFQRSYIGNSVIELIIILLSTEESCVTIISQSCEDSITWRIGASRHSSDP